MKDDYADLLEFAWILIANVNNGDWSQQSEDWRESVYRFRDRYHAVIRNRLAQPQTSEPVILNKGEP